MLVTPLFYTLSDAGQHGITVKSGSVRPQPPVRPQPSAHPAGPPAAARSRKEERMRELWYNVQGLKILYYFVSLRIFTKGAQIFGRFKSSAQIGR